MSVVVPLRTRCPEHRPADIVTRDWIIGAGGLLVLPFIAVAKVRGKCQ